MACEKSCQVGAANVPSGRRFLPQMSQMEAPYEALMTSQPRPTAEEEKFYI